MAEEQFIGIDLGGTKIEIATISKKGLILEKIRLATDVKGGYPAVYKQIKESIDKFDLKTIKQIGIGVAGQIEGGLIHNAPNLYWSEAPLGKELQEAFQMPVKLLNDVQAAAWGEWLIGAGHGFSSMMAVFIGTGIGSGLVVEGKLFQGSSFAAGEIGHMLIRAGEGLTCSCGNIGCFEAWGGGWAIAQRAQMSSAQEVIQAYRQKDPDAEKIIKETFEVYIEGFINLTHAFNPACFVLGGGILEGLPEILNWVEEGVKKRAFKTSTKNLTFKRAQLGQNSGVIGAALY